MAMLTMVLQCVDKALAVWLLLLGSASEAQRQQITAAHLALLMPLVRLVEKLTHQIPDAPVVVPTIAAPVTTAPVAVPK
jgi:hypothetical protein